MVLIKNATEIDKMRVAGKYAVEILTYVGGFVREGVRTIELEKICEVKLKEHGNIRPAFKGYNGYPYCLCISTNSEVVHGMPGERLLSEGDLVSIDFGVEYKGYYGDVARTFGVGHLSEEARRLMEVTEASLFDGIRETCEGNRLNDISSAIQKRIESAGYSVVREFVGHGIGRSLHEEPQVPNYGERGKGVRLKKGMVFAIEPMVNMGECEILIDNNGWTAVTRDGSLSAHFEHTVAITDNGPEILTRL